MNRHERKHAQDLAQTILARELRAHLRESGAVNSLLYQIDVWSRRKAAADPQHAHESARAAATMKAATMLLLDGKGPATRLGHLAKAIPTAEAAR